MEFNATFLVSTISFIVFVLLMNKILYAPLQKIVEDRKTFIDDNYAEANNAKEKSVSLIEDRKNRLSQASSDARKVMQEKTDIAKSEKAELCSTSRLQANEEIKNKKEELNNQSQQTSEELKNNIASIASVISSKILGENVTVENVERDVVDRIMQ